MNSFLWPTEGLNTNFKEKVFCNEDYAASFYKELMSHDADYVAKDLKVGHLLRITDIVTVYDETSPNYGEVLFEVNGNSSVSINMFSEKRFCKIVGYEPAELLNNLLFKDWAKEFIDLYPYVKVVAVKPTLKLSMMDGSIERLKQEFMEQVSKPTSAYVAKIIDKNRGGFFVDINGVPAFLPGGLASANKITDFNAMLGKSVYVMIDDYLPDMNTFIVSNKKYIFHIIPERAKNLDIDQLFTGIITGTTPFGIFIEYDGIFTGLLHTSKMNAETLEKFSKGRYKAGQQISCFVEEITRDYKLVFTSYTKEERDAVVVNYVKDNPKVVAKLKYINKHEAQFKIESTLYLVNVSVKELKKINNIAVGDKVTLHLTGVKDRKILAKIDETETNLSRTTNTQRVQNRI